MKWITRERPKIDRIACPWLIARFIDKTPEFLYVPKEDVLRIARENGAIPYDIPGAELTHE
ncbi:MAG: chromate resistance protein ChrB domain-containing protein, partial [Bdellovibrionota bacterium]